MLNPAVAPGLGESSFSGSKYGRGVANIKLRNMGTNRSLVLVDGHRWVSGGARTAAVDLNTIPSALIDRVETVTGGAAAIYGADAVTGAVNVVMKKQLDKPTASFTTGISDQGDAAQTPISCAIGLSFADDRAHLVVGANQTLTYPVLHVDRLNEYYSYQVNPANTGPNDGIPDNYLIRDRQFYRSSCPTFCIYNGTGQCGTARGGDRYQLINGQVENIPKSDYIVVTNGDVGIQNWIGESRDDTGVGLSHFDNLFLRDKSKKGSDYANLEFKPTDNLTWNTSFGYAHSFVSGVAEWPEYRDDARATNWWGPTIGGGGGNPGGVATLDDPYLPDSLRAFMGENGLTEIRLSRHYYNIPAPLEQYTRDAFTFGTDLTGKLTDRLDWQAFVRYGEVEDDIKTINMVGRLEWMHARDTLVDASGNIVCADAVARTAGCAPFNLYTTDVLSRTWQDCALFTRYETTKNSMLNAGLGINGSLFSLPAGDVRAAAGVEWRQEKLTTRDDPDAVKLANIVISPGNDNALHPDMDAERKVSEAYSEVVVPLLNDVPFARKLEIEGAYRYSDYSDNSSTDTWKAGLIWSPFRGLTLRGVKSFSTRVPNFGELYSPIGMLMLGQISDPCQMLVITQDNDRAANCAATVPGWTAPLPRPNLNQPRVFSGGNRDLEPKTSNSFFYGLVWQPTFLRGFDRSADWWEIEIDDVITSLAYTTIMNNCVNPSGGPNMGYCQFVHRFTDTADEHLIGEVDWVQAQYANLAGRLARSIDYSANYRFGLGPDRARAAFSGTRLLEQTVIAQVGSAGTDNAGAWNYPDFKGTLALGYDIGDFSFGMNSTYISKSRYSVTDQSDETRELPCVPAYYKHDLSLTWHVTDQLTPSLGVRNFTNNLVDHPALRVNVTTTPHPSEGGSTSAPYYDVVGALLLRHREG